MPHLKEREMIESIDEYLSLLKAELADSDPAIIQDALSDAEEHLRTALQNELAADGGLSEAKVLPAIVEKYGDPAEIAAAYMEIEARTQPALAVKAVDDRRSLIARFFSVITEPRAWGALIYMFFSIVAGLIYFTWAITGLSLSLGLMILIIGIPVLIFFLLSIRTLALVEGRVVEALLGVRMPRRPMFIPAGVGWWERLKNLFLARRTWTGILYMLLQLPLGILYFTIFAFLVALSIALILAPLPDVGFQINTGNVVYDAPTWLMPFVVVAGSLVFVATMHLAKFIGRLHGAVAKSLLMGI
jgi:hypothetical protein